VVNEAYPRTLTYYDIMIIRSCVSATSSAASQAGHVLEQRYQMSPIEHAPTETNGSIAAPTPTTLCRLHSTQALFFSLDTCAKILDVPRTPFISSEARRRGFRGKGRYPDRAACHLGAMLTGRPVRYIFGRERRCNMVRREAPNAST